MAESQSPELEAFKPDPATSTFEHSAVVEPYPSEDLPEILRDGVDGIVGITQCPLALAAVAVVTSASLVAQAHVDVMLIHGEAAPTSLFCVTVAQSGERKTAADKLARAPILEHQAEKQREYEELNLQFTDDLESWEVERKRILTSTRKSKQGDDDTIADNADVQTQLTEHRKYRPEPPLFPLFIAEEPTPEGWVKALRLGPGYIGIYSSEGQFFHGHGMKDENRMKTATAASAAWDGSAITRVRGGDELAVVQNRRLALSVMMQPVLARPLFADENLRGQGFLARVLPAFPESTIGTRLYRPATDADRAALKRFQKRIAALLRQPVPLVEGTRNELAPKPLVLGGGAHAALVEFYNWAELQSGEDGTLAPIAAVAAKIAEQAARIAGVFCFVQNPDANEIDFDTMRRAISVARWHLNEALRLFDDARTDDNQRNASRILAWLMEHPEYDHVSVTELQQSGPRPIRKDRAAIELALLSLEQNGSLLRVVGGASVRGKVRRKAWRVVSEASE